MNFVWINVYVYRVFFGLINLSIIIVLMLDFNIMVKVSVVKCWKVMFK